jgi:hypothetical protein
MAGPALAEVTGKKNGNIQWIAKIILRVIGQRVVCFFLRPNGSRKNK